MPNAENLKNGVKTQFKSGEDAVNNALKSAEVRRENKKVRDTARIVAKAVLDCKPELDKKQYEALKKLGLKGKGKPSMRDIGMLVQGQKSMKGDLQAYRFLLSLAGEDSGLLLGSDKGETAYDDGKTVVQIYLPDNGRDKD